MSSSKRSGKSSTTKKDDLLSKEEEFKRLNAELEKKTTSIVYEAEQVLRAQEKNQADTDYFSKLLTEEVPGQPLRVESQAPVKFKVDDDLKKIIQDVAMDGEDSDVGFDGGKSEDVVPKVANQMSSDAQIR